MNFKSLKSLVLASTLLFSSVVPSFANKKVSRIAGSNRYETALRVNKKYFKKANGNCAVLTTGTVFKSAMLGSFLASSLNVPYYLNSQHGISSSILNDLKKLNVKRVYIVGEFNELDKSIENTLISKGIKPERIRYISASEFWGNWHGFPRTKVLQINDIIYNTFNNNPMYDDLSGGLLVNTDSFPDSLSVTPFIAEVSKHFNLGLVDYTDEYMDDSSYEFIVGGINTIPENFESSIRFDGSDRYETAYLIANYFRDMCTGEFEKVDPNGNNTKVKIKNRKSVIVVNGESYSDALSSSISAINESGVVLLTPRNSLNEYTKRYIEDNNIKNIVIVGGENSVSKNVEDELRKLN